MIGIKSITAWKTYIRIADKHLIFDMSRDNPEWALINAKTLVKNQNYHFFVSSIKQVNNDLKDLVGRAQNYARKVIIHIPKSLDDVRVAVKLLLGEELKYKIVVERFGPVFSLENPRMKDWLLRIRYEKGSIATSIDLMSKGIDTLSYHSGMDHDSPVGNIIRQLHPAMFKDKIIKQFKSVTPDGILKSFKSDDDIWDYIMQSGEWNVRIEDKKEDHKP